MTRSVILNEVKDPRKNATRNRPHFLFNGFSLIEMAIACTILGFILFAAVITISKTIKAKKVEGSVEKLAGLIRMAQDQAISTETIQAIFLAESKLLWVNYPKKTIDEVRNNLGSLEGKEIRMQEFKENFKINELWIANEHITEIPEEPANNIAIVIDEKGIMTKAKIIMNIEEIANFITVNENNVVLGISRENEILPLSLALSIEALIPSSKEAIVCNTEPIIGKGWQTVLVDNLEDIKEIKIRIKTDSKLASSIHFHVYTFEGAYVNKRASSGIPPVNPNSDRPVGNWNANESTLLAPANTKDVLLPVYSTITGHYLYKNTAKPMPSPLYKNYMEINLLPMFTAVVTTFATSTDKSVTLNSALVPANSLNPGSKSDFATKWSENLGHGRFTYSAWYSSSQHPVIELSTQRKHLEPLENAEILSGDSSTWLTIPTNSSSSFMKIIFAVYHKDKETNQEYAFNSHPTIASGNPDINLVNTMFLDYSNDPFVYLIPWIEKINDPLWLSMYAYALKPLTRPSCFSLLATTGPLTGDSYAGYWYGPILLDWDKLLGEENISELIGWFSALFDPENWVFKQGAITAVNTFAGTYAAPPVHFWLKNFSYLSYWLLFQNALYNQHPSDLPKRIQEPFGTLRNVLIGHVFGNDPIYKNLVLNNFSFWQRAYINTAPHESSSLSIPIMSDAEYPVWLATLPAIFNQTKIGKTELYGSFYYLQERINHIMLDLGIWLKSYSTQLSDVYDKASYDALIYTAAKRTLPKSGGGAQSDSLPEYTSLGNLEKWSWLPAGFDYNTASWWSWYQTITAAKAQAFPEPNGREVRYGWNIPVMAPVPSYDSYLIRYAAPLPSIQYNSSFVKLLGNYNTQNSYNYDIVNGAYSKHTLFFGTAHYALGSIQIAVKKK